jgi:hypothetical protein
MDSEDEKNEWGCQVVCNLEVGLWWVAAIRGRAAGHYKISGRDRGHSAVCNRLPMTPQFLFLFNIAN